MGEIIIFLVVFGFLIGILRGLIGQWHRNAEIKRAGNAGEKVIKNVIKSVLRDGDILLNNVEVNYDGKQTELDNLVINRYGVFIVEVKNYNGVLRGGVDDREWTKCHISSGHNRYEKTVRNPIPQVKRQVYILSNYLKSRGIRVWVDGYVVFVNNNSPVRSPYVLESISAIDRTIHTVSKNRLTDKEIQRIKAALR